MKRIVVPALVLLAVMIPFLGAINVSAATPYKALILSSLERFVPTAYSGQLQKYLVSAGYQVTLLKDTAVTLNVLTTQLNSYDMIIWRTNIYDWAHTTYWYVGELSNSATLKAYAAEFAAGVIDNTNGILGVSIQFFINHFSAGSLSKVKLLVLVSSSSAVLAQILIGAGAKSAVDYYESFSLAYGTIDYVTTLVMKFLSNGATVSDSVWNTIRRFMNVALRNPLDSKYIPPLWWMGDGLVKIV